MLRADIIGSALGVSLLLLVYYTTVAFGVIYLVTVFGFTPKPRQSAAELELDRQRDSTHRRRHLVGPAARAQTFHAHRPAPAPR